MIEDYTDIKYYIEKGISEQIAILESQLLRVGEVLGRENRLSDASTEYFFDREQALIETIAKLREYSEGI